MFGQWELAHKLPKHLKTDGCAATLQISKTQTTLPHRHRLSDSRHPKNKKKTEQCPSTNNTQTHLLRESNDRCS